MTRKSRAWGSPSRYIQGMGEIQRLPEHTAKFGDRVGAVIDVFFFDSYTKILKNRYEEREQSFHSIKYEEEVTIQYIESVVEIMKKYSPDVIVGIGGGKSIDSAKSVAAKMQEGYGIYGSPAYAVDHGVLELAERKPDICLSGINYGENLGTNLTCSGTVDAILEASTHQIPGIAFSIPAEISIQRSRKYPEMNWEAIKKVVYYWTDRLLSETEISGSKWLNINMPGTIPPPQEYRFTKQSMQNYFVFRKPLKRDFSKQYDFTTVINYEKNKLDERDDIYAVCVQKITSVTPIVHDLTEPKLR